MELIILGVDSLSSQRSSVVVFQEQHCNYMNGFRYMICYINDHLGRNLSNFVLKLFKTVHERMLAGT